jgi:uncharacterized Fe-S cluster protein YjdI
MLIASSRAAREDQSAHAAATSKEVSAMALQVTWDSKVCIHSGNCVKTLPQVFKVENKKFVIDPSAADDDKVRAAVKACPSKALKISE